MCPEPILSIGSSFSKPDIVARKDGKLCVLETCIKKCFRFEPTRVKKVQKYSVEGAGRALMNPSATAVHAPVISSNHGMLGHISGLSWRHLGCHNRLLADLSVATILGSLNE